MRKMIFAIYCILFVLVLSSCASAPKSTPALNNPGTVADNTVEDKEPVPAISAAEAKYITALEDYEAGNFEAAKSVLQELGGYRAAQDYLNKIAAMIPYQGTWKRESILAPSTIVIKGWELTYIIHYDSGDTKDTFSLTLNKDATLNSSGSDKWVPSTLHVNGNGALVYTVANSDNPSVYEKESDFAEVPDLICAPSIGMTKKQVLVSTWGQPKKVNTTTTANGVTEQWVYPRGYIYFKNEVVTTIQERP
ncbi:MAG: hypothetical protein ABFD97_00375 [Syntrophobacter sp.]